MTFWLYIKQAGEGCDYTVGCAQKLVALKADTVEAARDEALRVLEHYGFILEDGKPDRERTLERAVIFEGGEVVDIEPIMAARRATLASEEASRAEEHERREFERLRAKYGGTE